MSWWKSLSPKRTSGAQLDSELRFHIDELIETNIAAGMSPQEARRRALLEFGGPEQIKEELRDVHRVPIAETTLKNFQWALRFLRKSPSFSVVVMLTLALGIGANSAVFSAIDAVLLRPLPFPGCDQLMKLAQYNTKTHNSQPFIAPLRVEDWNSMNSTFQAIAGYYPENASEISGPLPEKLTQAIVTPRFLKVLGISPALGRDFSLQEEHFGGPQAVLISDRFWRRRFAADPNVIGKRIVLSGFRSSYSIIGVLPPRSASQTATSTSGWLALPTRPTLKAGNLPGIASSDASRPVSPWSKRAPTWARFSRNLESNIQKRTRTWLSRSSP